MSDPAQSTEDCLLQLEAAWIQHAGEGIVTVVAANPEETFYAASIWLLYVDYTAFGVPCLSMNTESHVAEHAEEKAGSIRWAPPEWRFDVLDAVAEALRPYYHALSDSLAGSDDVTWEAAIGLHQEILARVCRRLTAQTQDRGAGFGSITLPPDFVVGIFEERETREVYDHLLRSSIEPPLLGRLKDPTWQT